MSSHTTQRESGNNESIIISNSVKIYTIKLATKFALHYLNSFTGGLEKGTFNNTEFQPLLKLRYLGDIFCLWTDRVKKSKELIKIPQCFSPLKIYYGLFIIPD